MRARAADFAGLRAESLVIRHDVGARIAPVPARRFSVTFRSRTPA